MSVLLLSGGLDSAVLLARETNARVCRRLCVTFDYSQRHSRELWSAYQIAHYYGAEHRRLGLPNGVLAGSALTGDCPVPRGHYADPIQAATVVPNRNMVLLSMAGSLAARLGHDEVLIGAHAGDAATYPDCRPEFVSAMDIALRAACGVGVRAPFLGMTKRDVVELGRSLLVPFDMTWSCYEGGDRPCGSCGACVERNEALS